MEEENIIMEEEQIQELLHQGEILQIEQAIMNARTKIISMAVLKCLIKVFRNEVKFGEAVTIFDYSLELDELKKHFIKVKLLLRRLEFDLPIAEQMELYDYCTKTKASKYLISQIILNNIFFQEKVCSRVIDIYSEKEGIDSEKVKYFGNLLRLLKEKKHG